MSKLHSFLMTQDFETAWRVYRDWAKFQQEVNRTNEVSLMGICVSGKNLWQVRITQEIHNHRLGLVFPSNDSTRSPQSEHSNPAKDLLRVLQRMWSNRTIRTLLTFPLVCCAALEMPIVGIEAEAPTSQSIRRSQLLSSLQTSSSR